MFTDDLWGILILAADRQHHALSSENLVSAGIPQDIQFKMNLRAISDYCNRNALPDLSKLVDGQPNSAVLNHDWLNQEIPEDSNLGVSHSLESMIDGAKRMRLGGAAAWNAAEQLVNRNWPIVARIVKDKVGPLPQTILGDSERVEHLALMIYPFLPSAVQFFVREKDFIKICSHNADKLLNIYLQNGVKS